jgi:predicted MPP superfamily phosphohydrolase
LLVAAAVLTAVGLAGARATPVMRQTTLRMETLPSTSRPFRVALLADVHLGNWGMDSARLGAIVEQVNAAQPDLVLLAGDFITGHDASGAAERAAGLTEPLARLNAPQGVVAALGNHDNWTAPAAVRAALARAGVTVLENASGPARTLRGYRHRRPLLGP